MKKLVLTTVISLVFILGLSAQDDKTRPQLGVKGGVNFATVAGDDIDERDARTSFNVGLLAEIPLTNRLSLQPEVLYSGQGFDIREIDQDNVFDTNDNVEYQLDYLQFPVLAKFYIIKGFYVEGGPQLGVKINEEIDTNPNNNDGDIPINADDSYIRDFDASAVIGTGYKFDNGFFVSGRFTHGLTDMFKDDTPFQNVEARNLVWQFGVGFMF